MLPVYWTLTVVLTILAGFLIYYYADHKAALYAKLLVFMSFTTSLLCFVILPIDIYESSLQNSDYVNRIGLSWKVIFYINFFMCWLVLPFAQEFEDSGEFSVVARLKESVKMNLILIGVLCGGATAIVIYLLLAYGFSIGQLPGVFATLVNIFGLTLVSIFMGYGLLSFPKECFIRRDYKALVGRCHRHAEAIKTQQQNITEQVFTIRQIVDRERQRDSAESRTVMTLIQQNFKFQNYCGHESDEANSLSKKSTADLHKIVKKRILQLNASASQLDQLVDDLKGITQSYLHNNYSKNKIFYTVLFVLVTLLTVLIFFAQLSTFATFLEPANVLRLLGWGGGVSFTFNVILSSYVAYIVANSIFRIKIYKIFALHRGHSSASSLLFTAINLSRVCYPLCFNYLQITNMPVSTFIDFFGQVTVSEKFNIIFPILLILFALFNVFDIYEKVAGYLGLASYAFDDEEAEEKREEGKSILVERFKERNLQNNQLQMIQLL